MPFLLGFDGGETVNTGVTVALVSEDDGYKVEASQARPPRKKRETEVRTDSWAYRHPWLFAIVGALITGSVYAIVNIMFRASLATAITTGVICGAIWLAFAAWRTLRRPDSTKPS